MNQKKAEQLYLLICSAICKRLAEGGLGVFCFLPLAFVLEGGIGLCLSAFRCGKHLEGKRITKGKRIAKGKLLKGKVWLKRG
jgi:hypothetical protein